MTRPTVLLSGVAVLGAAGLAYSAGYERNAFTLRRFEVPVLAPGSRELRLLHVSDIHMIGRQRRKQAWLRDLARLEPDLVVTTGDHIASVDGIPAVLDALSPLFDRPGAFVLGSNDYYGPLPKNPLKYFNPHHRRVVGLELPWGDVVAGLTGAGWRDMSNARCTVDVGGRLVEVRGVDDPHLQRDRLLAVAGPVEPSADLALALVHSPEPRVLDAFVRDGAQLMLAGHTHGGQLRIPGIGALVTNCGIDRARCRGLSRYGGGSPDDASATNPAWLHVSAGLGTSPYAPVRFACPPEATLLTLVAADRAAGRAAAA